MHIAMGADGNYTSQLITSICSVIENNKNIDTIKFHIMDNGINESDKNDIINFVHRSGREIQFYNFNDMDNIMGFEVTNNTSYPKGIYYGISYQIS